MPGSGKSTLTERSVTPATATLEGVAAEPAGSAGKVGLVDTVTIAVARRIAPTEGPTVQACGLPDILMGFLLVWDQAMVSSTPSMTERMKPPPFQFGLDG